MGTWLKRHFPAVDRNVDRIGYWAGFFALLWAAMSGIASSISGLSQYGWGAVVFAGLAVACAFVLVFSAFLACWRYFNPLPLQMPIETKQSPAGPQKEIPSEKIRQLDRTAFLLATFARDQFFRRRLLDALEWWEGHPRDVPSDTNEKIQAETKRVDEFIDDLRSNLGDSYWGGELYRVIGTAETQASWEIKEMAVPAGLNPFYFRDFHIACTKYDKIGQFLQRAGESFKSAERQEYELIRDQIGLHK